MLLNQRQSKLGQTCANSECKIDTQANSWHAKAERNFAQMPTPFHKVYRVSIHGKFEYKLIPIIRHSTWRVCIKTLDIKKYIWISTDFVLSFHFLPRWGLNQGSSELEASVLPMS